jgi:tRNA(Arg) A34 adenosine deaminase TadA
MADSATVAIDLPEWALGVEEPGRRYRTAEDRMHLVIELALRNVQEGTGGPFGAAVFETESGRLVAVGVNSVVRLRCSVLHAEVIALARAQKRLGSYTLAAAGMTPHSLYTSCDPCAMCLGAALWAGVKEIVCAAAREDAVSLRFDEGPVFPESYSYLRQRGITIRHGLLREAARDVLELYRRAGGVIYNP